MKQANLEVSCDEFVGMPRRYVGETTSCGNLQHRTDTLLLRIAQPKQTCAMYNWNRDIESDDEFDFDWYDDEYDSWDSEYSGSSEGSEDDEDWRRQLRLDELKRTIESVFHSFSRRRLTSAEMELFLSQQLQKEIGCAALVDFFEENPDRELQVLDAMLSVFSFERTVMQPCDLLLLFTQAHSNTFAMRMVGLLSQKELGRTETMLGLVDTANRIDTRLRKWDDARKKETAQKELRKMGLPERPRNQVCDFFTDNKHCGYGSGSQPALLLSPVCNPGPD